MVNVPTDGATLLLLDRDSVADLLTPDDVLEAVREAFVLHSTRQGRSFPVVRERLAAGVFGIKSGDVQTQELLGFKAAGFWPTNRARGAEPHQATIMLFDPATGRPLCMLDGNRITTMRTGAAGAIGLQLLSRAGSRTLTVFGTGVQARIQVEFALRVRPSITHVEYLSHNALRHAGFEAHLQTLANPPVVVHRTDANAAVTGADIVITATPGGGALFDASSVQAGTHINAVGTDTRGKRELPVELLAVAALYVDDVTQARSIGELQWAAQSIACVEIGELLSKNTAPVRTDDAITLFDMTGLALQDLTVAQRLHQRAQSQGRGISLPWAR